MSHRFDATGVGVNFICPRCGWEATEQDVHATIADLRHQLAVRADENDRLEYELRKAQRRHIDG